MAGQSASAGALTPAGSRPMRAARACLRSTASAAADAASAPVCAASRRIRASSMEVACPASTMSDPVMADVRDTSANASHASSSSFAAPASRKSERRPRYSAALDGRRVCECRVRAHSVELVGDLQPIGQGKRPSEEAGEAGRGQHVTAAVEKRPQTQGRVRQRHLHAGDACGGRVACPRLADLRVVVAQVRRRLGERQRAFRCFAQRVARLRDGRQHAGCVERPRCVARAAGEAGQQQRHPEGNCRHRTRRRRGRAGPGPGVRK